MLALYILNIVVVAIVVVVHYEFLHHASRLIPRMRLRPRLRIVFGVGTALIAHTVEVWVFAIAYYFVLRSGYWGTLEGNFHGSLLDCVYFAFTTFSTLGFGDIHPVGDIRFLTGISSLTGMVLVSWTASFLYLEMQRLWRND
jgi:Ion channel